MDLFLFSYIHVGKVLTFFKCFTRHQSGNASIIFQNNLHFFTGTASDVALSNRKRNIFQIYFKLPLNISHNYVNIWNFFNLNCYFNASQAERQEISSKLQQIFARTARLKTCVSSRIASSKPSDAPEQFVISLIKKKTNKRT